jgi:hypothetical protein
MVKSQTMQHKALHWIELHALKSIQNIPEHIVCGSAQHTVEHVLRHGLG